MHMQTIAAILGVIATLCAGAGVFIKKVLPFVRKMNHFVDDMVGEDARPGMDARPGVIARLASIEHELHPNSGKSLRDQTDRLEQALDAHLAACPPTTTTINVNPSGG